MPIEGIQSAAVEALPLQQTAAVRAVVGGRPNLQLGEVIRAVVLGTRLAGTDRYLVEIGGDHLEAVIPGGLVDGQPVRLRVAEVQPQLVLHPLETAAGIEAEVVSLIRAHLGESPPTAESLVNLQQALEKFVAAGSPQDSLADVFRLQAFLHSLLNSEAAPDAEEIATFVQDGGLHYEAKLAEFAQSAAPGPGQALDLDLKGLLLRIERDLTEETSLGRSPENNLAAVTPGTQPSRSVATGPVHAALIDHLASQLGRVETQQAINLLAQLHGAPYQLQIPLYTGHAFSTVYVGIDPDSTSEETDPEKQRSGHNLLFHLELDKYGQTRIDARILDRSIRVNFFVADAPAVAEIRSQLPVLHQALRTIGFSEVLLAADALDDLPAEKSRKFAALLAGVPGNVHLLDVKV